MTDHPTMSRPSAEDDLDASLLERYWLGETSPDETAAVEAWFVAHPGWQGRYNQLGQGVQWDPSVDFSSDDVHRLLGKVLDVTGNPRTDEEHSTTAVFAERFQRSHDFTRPLTRSRFRAIGIGLAMILTVGLTWTWIRERVGGTAEQTYATGIGQRITVALVDGSRVTLAPQTTVRVVSAFGVSARTVSVQGEAHFDVASAAGIPFVVQAGTVETRVLGTRFVIKHYGDDPGVQVAVETGKVAVGHANTTPAVLTAGVVAMVRNSGITISDSTGIAPYTEWVNGQLTFQDTPLLEALATLSRWYGVQFRIGDSSLSTARITGKLPYGSLEDMLRVMENMLMVSLTYKRQDDGSLLVTLGATHAEASVPLRRSPLSSPPTLSRR